MSEMLGNQYFLARKYCEAMEQLEEALLLDPANKPIKKKLIICFILSRKFQTALSLFEQLIIEDIAFIMDSDPYRDDCPCPKIIYEFENNVSTIEEYDRLLILGVLWLYCDIEVSIKYFEKVVELDKNNTTTNRILRKLKLSEKQLKREDN